MKKTVLLMVVAAAFLASCESKTYADLSGPSVTNPTYQANVKPVVDAQCVSCHFAGGEEPPLTNYTQVKDESQNGDFLCKINGSCGSIMPPSGKMAQATVDMINLWAQQGFVEK